jgi:Uma2 family endonuclease
MGKPEIKYITQEEYLDAERVSLDKHEYFQGEIFAMSGASIPHNIVFRNTFLDLGNKLKGKSCEPFGSDLRIHIPESTLYTYPDLSIICGEIETTDANFDTATNPTVIIEILSKSTRGYDKGDKFALYRQIKSLQEYLLIDSERVLVEKYIRNKDESWQLNEYRNLELTFDLASVKVVLQLSDIYEGVKFKD